MSNKISFQDIIMKLQNFWMGHGCAILQPHTLEMGAGTFHPATILKTLSTNPWNVAFVQPSIRPGDSRYGAHPNRMQHYYQFQVILKPSPENIQDLYLDSLAALGIDKLKHDIRFVEDDWESPTLGAAGLGWEVWCNGMEISQFTYMQQICGVDCRPVAGEITYGLERIALYIQEIDEASKIDWNGAKGDKALNYSEIDFEAERQYSRYNLEEANTDILLRHFDEAEQESISLVKKQLPFPAYDFCIRASHIFNLLDARGVISTTERAAYIARVRHLAKISATCWLEMQGGSNG